ncbi:bifunctional diaminohydroxyphosphoribosylaminopyrimidine deaminase/5-amino-6-(5-phosphoribosylamino)uracil reductase RibD [Prolixibacteraceae bacterium JC049]|nr:bifunctional diaminohydroxyphosphoribosylaminopyrimidine deaminase/5-amino-6-(5-phosphoribosylamino)uracil reductase RibD [Prolixibacteraceae bacterium JC049]
MKQQEQYMQRCLDLARLGRGRVAPNPMVGSVIVHNNKIIGEGYHQKYGEPHAEVNAIASVSDESLLPESTLYVNLEPCAHYGKTPPCSLLIIEKGIKHVVIGTVDPFAKVAGKGIEMMEKAGIKVEINVLKDECWKLNRRFFTFHQQKRPFVILKWAQTPDGYIDIDRSAEDFGQPTWITNELARTSVHRLRAEEAAIMIGTKTAQKDNPSLSVRDWQGAHPLRIVLDREMKLRSSLHVFDQTIPTLVFTQETVPSKKNLEYVSINFANNILSQVLSELYQRNIQSVIVEGGSRLLENFITQNLWDEARVYIGHRFFHKGIKAPEFTGQLSSFEEFDESRLCTYRNI